MKGRIPRPIRCWFGRHDWGDLFIDAPEHVVGVTFYCRATRTCKRCAAIEHRSGEATKMVSIGRVVFRGCVISVRGGPALAGRFKEED